MADAPPHYGATIVATDAAVAGDGGRPPRAAIFAALLALLVVSEGYDFGVLNGAIVLIQKDLGASTWEISAVVAVTPLSVMAGSALGGFLSDRFGRWRALLMCCAVLAIGPVGTALAPDVVVMAAFRALVGVGIGAGLLVVSMYLAEIAPADERGRLTILEETAIASGMLLGYMANWAMMGVSNDWRWMLGLGGVPPLVVAALLCLPQVPESPRWLYAVGREREAEETLRAYVGATEAQEAMAFMAEQQCSLSPKVSDPFLQEASPRSEFNSSMEELVAKPGLCRMLVAGIAVAVAQMACGYLGMAYYSSKVLKSVLSTSEAFQATIAMGASKVVLSLFAFATLERTGRRTMLLASAACCTIASAWLAWCFARGTGAAPLVFGFCLFMGGHAAGLGGTTYVYIAEVFTTEWRAKGMATSICCSRFCGVINTFFFPLLLEAYGAPATLTIQAVVCTACTVAIWLFAYETGGQSLEELSRMASEPSSTVGACKSGLSA